MSDEATPRNSDTSPNDAATEVTTREMTLDFVGLMSILANSLYSEKKVFIRELVQNAHDGIRRREKLEANYNGRIDIETRPEEGWIAFTDDGVGMTADDLHGYLSRIGASGTDQLGRVTERVEGARSHKSQTLLCRELGPDTVLRRECALWTRDAEVEIHPDNTAGAVRLGEGSQGAEQRHRARGRARQWNENTPVRNSGISQPWGTREPDRARRSLASTSGVSRLSCPEAHDSRASFR